VRIRRTGHNQEIFTMMTMQAREMCAPYTNPNQTLRAYASNSPRAKARLVVLAMLADGRLDDAELESLTRHGTFAELGIAREDFFEVLYDFCADVENLPNGSGDYLLSPVVLEQLFGEIDSAAERQTLLRQIFNMIRSDGHLADSEADLFWHAVDTWKFRAADMRTALRSQQLRRQHGAAGQTSA
jgi:uncharacterized tellurite resistance protein B-like protein